MFFPAGALNRFHDAQNAGAPPVVEVALAELRSGSKRNHWIWFVLPQLRSLGRSANAQLYGIADLAEALPTWRIPLLHQQLEAVMEAFREQLNQPGQGLEQLMGGGLDAAKTVSSLTYSRPPLCLHAGDARIAPEVSARSTP